MTGEQRKIERIIRPEPVMEGAGVLVHRTIATRALNYVDPFLLLDHFDSTDSRLYEAGFPMHPHRGIETVTYVLSGQIHHGDSMGNNGAIGGGDVQWMTSGSGILHEEMPDPKSDRMAGFQLWVNLPAKDKMTRPRYQDVRSAQIPEIRREDGSVIRVVAGTFDGVSGPISGIAANPTYVDVALAPDTEIELPVEAGHSAFSYAFENSGSFGSGHPQLVTGPSLVVWGDGDRIRAQAGPAGLRFLLVSAKPLHEPVARYGPFVMNTKEEIEDALRDLKRGSFVRP